MLRFFSSLFSSIFILGIISIVTVLYVIWHFGQSLPDYKQLATYTPPITTRLYASDGTLLNEYAKERRIFVPIEKIPDKVKYAFMSAEDKNFYNHIGIDFIALTRAVVTNVLNMVGVYNGGLVGASTITQQVAKNFLLTSERTLNRKIKEAILSLRMERTFSKDHIFELYLNEIYLGQSAYGVAAASLNYFNKDLSELTLAEAAYLAALPKAPNRYNPATDYDDAIERRNWVLGRMVKDGRISEQEALLAQAEDIIMDKRPKEDMVQNAQYYSEEVRREVVNTMGEDSIYQGGLAIRTSLVPRLQEIAYTTLRQGLINYDRNHGYRGHVANIVMDENWLESLAAVEKPVGALEDWHLAAVISTSPEIAALGFADGSQGLIHISQLKWARKSGIEQTVGDEILAVEEVLKPGDVILAKELSVSNAQRKKQGLPELVKDENGEYIGEKVYGLRQVPNIEGAMVVMDPHTGRVWAMVGGFDFKRSQFNRAVQAYRQPGSSFKPFIYLAALDQGYTPSSLILDAPFVLDQGPGMPKWKPHNYNTSISGETTMRVGLEHSKNLMTVRMAQAIGMDTVVDYAKRFGIKDDLEPLLSMSLGAGETTLLKMSNAYAMIVNGGKKVTPSLIDRIQDREGKTIYKHDLRECMDCEVDFTQELQPPSLPDDREQITDPMSAYQMVNMMQGVVERGSGWKGRVWGRPLAAKTGTSDSQKDVWFIGFSPDMVVGIFMGFDTPRTLGKGSTGGMVGGPIFKSFMTQALKGQPATPFRIPPGIKLVRVDRKSGKPLTKYSSDNQNIILEAFKPGTENSQLPVVMGSSTMEDKKPEVQPEPEIKIDILTGEEIISETTEVTEELPEGTEVLDEPVVEEIDDSRQMMPSLVLVDYTSKE